MLTAAQWGSERRTQAHAIDVSNVFVAGKDKSNRLFVRHQLPVDVCSELYA